MTEQVVFQVSEWREFNELNDCDNDIESANTNLQDFKIDDKDKFGSNKLKTLLNPKYYAGYKENNENRQYIIRIFGRTLDDKSVHVKVTGYIPHFYIELPDKWTDANTEKLIIVLNEHSDLRHVKNNLVTYDTIVKHKFRGFTNNQEFRFLRLVFNNSNAMKAYSNLLFKNRMFIPGMTRPVKFTVYESVLDSMLRCMHIRDVLACGWIEIKKYKQCLENTTCDINIECDWQSVKQHANQKMTAKFKVAVFDIECESGDGSFPQPERIEDKIIQIGTVFAKHNQGIYRKHIITLKSCDPIEDVEVISVNTEKELLLEWTKLMKQESPDFMTGYNTWQFDEIYMYKRSLHPSINCQKLFCKLSKLSDYNSILDRTELSSSALGDNIMKHFDSIGITQIDLMKIIQAEHKLDKWSLDFVSEHFVQEKIIKYTILNDHQLEIESKNLHIVKVGNYVKIINQAELEYGLKDEVNKTDDENDDDETYCDTKYKITSINGNKMVIESSDNVFTENGLKELGKGLKWGLVKDDIKANDIFRLQKGTSADRKIIAEYCIQDCVLVYKIMERLAILTSKINMANVCHVPFYYLLFRGQGIKGLSLISKRCRQKGFLIPVLIKMEDDISYEGAIVFDPVLGFYQTYILVLDYNSLYPSSMIDGNISHEMILLDSKFDNLPDYTYRDVPFTNDDGSSTICRFAKKRDGTPGIIPGILIELLSERKKAKKEMETEEDPAQKANLNGKQNALKITANSIYGILGAGTSPLCMKELAASTTAIGRHMLETARTFVENDFVPILKKYYEALQLEDDDKIKELNNLYLDVSKQSSENIEFIRCALGELLNNFDINPHVIYGDSCTGDTPIILNINGKIKIQTFNEFNENQWSEYRSFKNPKIYEQLKQDNLIDDNFKHPGCNELYEKQQIETLNQDIKIWTHKGWTYVNRIIRHKTDKKIYRITTDSGCVDVTEDHSLLDISGNQIKPKDCKIGQALLHSIPLIGHCNKINNDDIKNNDYITHDKKDAQICYMEMSLSGYSVIIDENNGKFKISWSSQISYWETNNTIKKICLLHEKYNDFVYDIETEYGVFHAGIGSMIIKNTDSIFTNMNIKSKETGLLLTNKEGLVHGIRLGQLASMFIKKRLPYPHNLEYEKTYYPFWIGRKKGYVGNKYGDNPDKFEQNSMGIALKRRDYAHVVKKLIGGLVNIMMNENDIDRAIAYIRYSIEKLLAGQYPITEFITTKSLKLRYKGIKLTNTSEGKAGESGRWLWYDVDCSQAHVKLCQRMRNRDMGTAPAVNDRVPSVAIIVKKKRGEKMLQGDMIEHPDYIKENNIKIDYLFYLTNQIMNPAVQFLVHMTPKPENIFNEYIKKEELLRNGNVPLDKFIVKTNNNDDDESFKIIVDPFELYDKTINRKIINVETTEKKKKVVRKPKSKDSANLSFAKKLFLEGL